MNVEEVIVQYVGDAKEVFQARDIEYQVLLGGYAIIRVTVEQLQQLRQDERILYIERPEALYYESDIRKQEAWLEFVCKPQLELTGRGVIMAYLDSGIDYRHPEFINQEGKSRIITILDLSREVVYEYNQEIINEALSLNLTEARKLVPELDYSGHGTHVAGIGSGNSGVAPGSDIIMVKLGSGGMDVSNTANLMRGIDFVVREALRREQPIVINISYGNSYGAHNGSSMVEQYLETVLNYGKVTIVVGAGNEGSARGHFSGIITGEMEMVELSIGEFQPRMYIQLWKRYEDELRIEVVPPGGRGVEIDISSGIRRYTLAEDELVVGIYGPTPRQRYQEIVIEIVPLNDYVQEGIWRFLVSSVIEKEVRFDMWLPVSEGLSPLTGFVKSSPDITITIPGTASRVITVGAYDTRFNQVAAFSGRGYTWNSGEIKPDLVAPGVGIVSASIGGGYTAKSGTSMAAPFVAGGAALLMEWGIVLNNDQFLYADKVKAYLVKGARPLNEGEVYPNPLAGNGRVCVEESFP